MPDLTPLMKSATRIRDRLAAAIDELELTDDPKPGGDLAAVALAMIDALALIDALLAERRAGNLAQEFAPTPDLPAMTTPVTVKPGSTGRRKFELPDLSPDVIAELKADDPDQV